MTKTSMEIFYVSKINKKIMEIRSLAVKVLWVAKCEFQVHINCHEAPSKLVISHTMEDSKNLLLRLRVFQAPMLKLLFL